MEWSSPGPFAMMQKEEKSVKLVVAAKETETTKCVVSRCARGFVSFGLFPLIWCSSSLVLCSLVLRVLLIVSRLALFCRFCVRVPFFPLVSPLFAEEVETARNVETRGERGDVVMVGVVRE